MFLTDGKAAALHIIHQYRQVHTTFVAQYQAKPDAYTVGANCSSTVGQPITISWSDPADTHVNSYEIRRSVKHNGVTGPIVTLATVGRGVNSYTDYDYVKTSSYVDLLQYEVRATYNSTDSNILSGSSDDHFFGVYGEMGSKENSKNLAQSEISKEVPAIYSISNYPNPFNPTTVIKYQIPEADFVTLKVYDILGKEVAALVNEAKEAGYYNATFNAKDLPSGIYIYTIQANGFNQSKKMLLIK